MEDYKKAFCLVLMILGCVEGDISAASNVQQNQQAANTAVSRAANKAAQKNSRKRTVPISGVDRSNPSNVFYTLQQMFNLITQDSPSANFHIPATGTNRANRQPIDDAHCWQIPPQLTGSVAADVIGLTSLWLKTPQDPKKPNGPFNGDISLQLFQDKPLVDFLVAERMLNPADSANYQKILVYFLFPVSTNVTNPATGQIVQGIVNYRCYFNDPCPGIAKRSAIGGANPAGNILKKWNIP